MSPGTSSFELEGWLKVIDPETEGWCRVEPVTAKIVVVHAATESGLAPGAFTVRIEKGDESITGSGAGIGLGYGAGTMSEGWSAYCPGVSYGAEGLALVLDHLVGAWTCEGGTGWAFLTFDGGVPGTDASIRLHFNGEGTCASA